MLNRNEHKPITFEDKINVAKFNERLSEIGLLSADGYSDYHIWDYKPPKARGQQPIYYICRAARGVCPVCGTPYAADAIEASTESTIQHYRKIKKCGKVCFEPVTLQLLRNRWRCYSCYRKTKKYNARWDDNSSLVASGEGLSKKCKEFIQIQSLRMEHKKLAEIFCVSEELIKKLFLSEVKKFDCERAWDAISTLGIYTVTLNIQGKTQPYCLCSNEKDAKLIELFPWSSKTSANEFLGHLQKEHISRVLVSVDSKAYSFARTNFPFSTILVDGIDVKSRLLKGLDEVKQEPENAESPEFPYLRRHWKDLDHSEPLDNSTKTAQAISHLRKSFPRIDYAYALKESGYKIYRIKQHQFKAVNDWINLDKHELRPFLTLQREMKARQCEVVDFAEKYAREDRAQYERLLNAAKSPMRTYYQSENKIVISDKSIRAAKFNTIRGKMLYGTAIIYNAAYKEYENGFLYDATYFDNELVDCIYESQENGQGKITLDNFGIPLNAYPALLDNMRKNEEKIIECSSLVRVQQTVTIKVDNN